MNFIAEAATDIGIAKDINQDSYTVRIINTKIGRLAFAVLCDGMGGLSKGEVASASVINAFNKWSETRLKSLCEAPILDHDIKREWINIVDEYNKKIINYSKKYNASMGTTITAMLLTKDRYYILNVGDSRAYEISSHVKILTKDHTVVQREIDLGRLTPKQAEIDSRRSILLQCVGASDELNPDMYFGDVKTNCVYMLCSDGFRHEITEMEMYKYLNTDMLKTEEDIKKNIKKLIQLNKSKMERDNISAISIKTI